MEFVGQVVGDLGATMAAGNVVVGDRLGLYRRSPPARPTPGRWRPRPAPTRATSRSGCAARRPAATWSTTPPPATYSLTPEKAFALTDPDGPVFLPGAFELALGALKAEPRIVEAFRTGAGVGWHEHDEEVFDGCERFFRPGYLMHLLPEWIPALDGVQRKLEEGATVADLGCGHGASTLLMAKAFPNSRFTGSDYHEGSIEAAARACAAGRCRRTGWTSRSPARRPSRRTASTW